jgi:hypothetical protein
MINIPVKFISSLVITHLSCAHQRSLAINSITSRRFSRKSMVECELPVIDRVGEVAQFCTQIEFVVGIVRERLSSGDVVEG